MTILPYGDQALLINFEQCIDPEVNSQVVALSEALQNTRGITFQIPAYCSLTVGFDPELTSVDLITRQIGQWTPKASPDVQQRILSIPICYEPPFGPDLHEVSQLTGMSAEEVIELHQSITYRVYMLGFIAGFAYLGKLPQALYCPRKGSPRKKVPKGAVGLAGHQTGIYPTEAPGGWQLIGQTPVSIFTPEQESPTLFRAGDQVKFERINKQQYEEITRAIASGNYKIPISHG